MSALDKLMVLSNFPTVIESILNFALKLSPVTSNAYEDTANIKTNAKIYFFIFSPFVNKLLFPLNFLKSY